MVCSVPNDTQREGLPLIHGTNVSRFFNGKEAIVAVRGLSFGISEGRITAIIGESGSGKSTMLKLIYGLLELDHGEIRYRGWRVPNPREKLIPGHDAMRMVSQGFDDLNTYANVWDNVASQLPNTDLEAKFRNTEQILNRLRIAHLRKQRIADLSGGEKQRVAIARALVNEPEVLLLDEPFNQVDASFRETLQADIRNIVADTGLTVVLVSHDPAEVLSMADELLVLRTGHLVAMGKPVGLYNYPPNAYTARLLAKSNILSKEEAFQLGIKVESEVALHPEWVALRENPDALFKIQHVYFKGFYEELLVGNGQFQIRVINTAPGTFASGIRVDIEIGRFHALH
ncbi:ABC transporter ATP-binding protein [Parapedobacter indicus]|uniref:ABC-type Fe3+/spermidine/putrescine transport systems, ATPase components n=1 Tax=Parapedobacter indicus TaxID=1477437 RepID=A0A1I3KJZ7_9SPHI|nr:ABC transporter ATP-binding protein [Parapedobacter indicus]PPL01845.1 ABC-type Fe3+/spermidine/putrescine transport system ATPase subunit [Parapedobacter indicus]SFI72819.1 ABC-type Fe3+/spermidine/putrescine transport systems, ATPase components [Parapedobacter indicus]